MISEHFKPGFGVVLDSYKPATSKSGAKSYLLCHRNKPQSLAVGSERARGGTGTNCKWKVTIEEAEEGWVVSKLNNLEHNHDLVKTTEEALAHASLRCIPEHLDQFGNFLKLAGKGAKEIHA